MAIADRLGDFPSTLDATRYHQNIANVWQLRKSNQYNITALHRYPMSRGSGNHVSPAGGAAFLARVGRTRLWHSSEAESLHHMCNLLITAFSCMSLDATAAMCVE